MTIFDLIKDIMSQKKNIIADDFESEKAFVPFMVQRWLSFHSDKHAILLNHTANKLWKAFDNKQTWYKFYCGVIPKTAYRNIKYIKKCKEKKKKEVDKEIVTFLAERLQLSNREVKEYLDSGEIDIKSLKRQIVNN